jgi:hypothetical protein
VPPGPVVGVDPMVGGLRRDRTEIRSKMLLPVDYGGRGKAKNTRNHALARKWTRVLRARPGEYNCILLRARRR